MGEEKIEEQLSLISKDIKLVVYGESSPIASGETKDDMAQNRRVEIKLAN